MIPLLLIKGRDTDREGETVRGRERQMGQHGGRARYTERTENSQNEREKMDGAICDSDRERAGERVRE